MKTSNWLRFVYAGVMQKKVKMMAVCYHLYHPHNERDRETVNYRIYEDTLRKEGPIAQMVIIRYSATSTKVFMIFQRFNLNGRGCCF
jgi:hypothetical protein